MSAMMSFDRIGKVLLEAYRKVGPKPSWGKAVMILCTGEKERIFADNVPVIVLSGALRVNLGTFFSGLRVRKKKLDQSSKENKRISTRRFEKEISN